jgi:hypothetical protein
MLFSPRLLPKKLKYFKLFLIWARNFTSHPESKIEILVKYLEKGRNTSAGRTA